MNVSNFHVYFTLYLIIFLSVFHVHIIIFLSCSIFPTQYLTNNYPQSYGIIYYNIMWEVGYVYNVNY